MAKKEISNVELWALKGSYTHQQLADEMGVHWTTVSRWFNGDMNAVRELRIKRAINQLDKKKGMEQAGN